LSRPGAEKQKSHAAGARRATVTVRVSAWTRTAADGKPARRSHNVPPFIAAAFVAWSMAPAFAETAPATDNALATLCGIVETSAREEGLPVNFFTRLIWRESSFRPGAVSPAGAQGVAQFMPGTANDRGLADPFDPATAIPASAKLIAELAQRFGNLGLAAAAYNAGPHALANWLAGEGDLPAETQDYVLAITGHDVGEWRGADPPSAAAPDPDQPCLASIAKLRVARGPDASLAVSGLFAPWGVQISASFDKGAALRAFARAQHEYSSVIGGITPFVLGAVLRSRGWRPFYRVRLPAQTGAEAKKLCDRLQAAGGACAVLRS
jgi:Transglycosylase SLT domain/SPOR domain